MTWSTNYEGFMIDFCGYDVPISIFNSNVIYMQDLLCIGYDNRRRHAYRINI